MNKIYKVIWNKKKLCWQAVSELATQGQVSGEAKKAIKKVRSNALTALMLPALSALSFAVSAALHDSALPTGANVTSGEAQFQNAGNQLNIQQNTQHLSTVWDTFNIGKKAEVNFVQPNQSSIAVNRVLDSNASQIMGKLNANGQVFLINPNGIVFSKTSQVNVGGLVASTLDLETDNQHGQMSFANQGKAGKIEQHGKITIKNGGTVALIAPQITQTGEMIAPNGEVRLTAADQVRIRLDQGKLASYDIDQGTLQALIDQGGVIIADDGRVHLTAQAQQNLGRAVVNHSGYIQANRLTTNSKGEIVLLADLAHGTTQLTGQLSAQGKNGQSGGFVETSAATVNITNSAKVNTQAELGAKIGQWLIDPVDFVVGKEGNITGAALSAALQHTDVTIQTRDTQSTVSTDPTQNTAPAGHGDILIQDAVTWQSGQALTLDAYNNIYINNVIDASQVDGGKLVLKYGQQSNDGSNGALYDADFGIDVPTYADYFIQAPVHLQQGFNFSTQRGSDDANLKEFQVITNAADMQAIKDDLVGNYALGSNINASSIANFVPIGTMIEGSGPNVGNRPFKGLFDGLGHVIENLTIHKQGFQGQDSYAGLFGKIEDADIRNVGLINAQIQGGAFVGGLIGEMTDSKLSNSFVQGHVEGQYHVGALVGYGFNSALDQVYSTGSVNYEDGESTLVGYLHDASITNGYFSKQNGAVTVWDGLGVDSVLSAEEAQQSQSYSNLGWDITNTAGQAAAWRIYDGQTGPLLKAFLTPLTIKADDYVGEYNGQVQNSNSYTTSVQSADPTQILGEAIYTGGSKNAGQAQSEITGLYSTQTGYDIDFVAGQVQINKAKISSIGNAVTDKIYDGSLTANLTGQAQANGLFGADQVQVNVGTASFLDKNAGDNKAVVLSEVTLSGQDATNYELVNELSTVANISRREIQNITGIQAQDKIYDGTRTAHIDQSQLVLDGLIVGDQLSLDANAQFTTKQAGTNKDVVIDQLSLGGADASNYVLSEQLQQSGTHSSADIHQAEIRLVDGLNVRDKVYDATTTAVLESQNVVFDGLVQGDQLRVDGTASFADKHAGENKVVYLHSLDLIGEDASNYRLVTQPYQLSASIDKAILNLSNLLATNKIYDGTLDTQVELWNVQIDGRLGNDLVNVAGGKAQFADKNAGQNKTVYISDLVLTGADAENYQLQQAPLTATANIAQRVISDMSGFGSIVKTYDAKLSAPLSTQYAQTHEAITGDNVMLYATDASFGDKNVGLNKVVRLHGLELIGADAANYALATNAQWYQGSINKALIADIQGLIAENKVYDGTTHVQLNQDQVKLAGAFIGDQLNLEIGQAQFATKNAGQDRLVSVSGLTLNGQDAQNYQLLPTSLNLQANIDQAVIHLQGVQALDKTYNGNINAQFNINDIALNGKIAGDDLGLVLNGVYADKNAGTDKSIRLVQAYLSGIDGQNYRLAEGALQTHYVADIHRAKISDITGLNADKVYDGTTQALINTTNAVLNGKIEGDDLQLLADGTFADKHAAADKNVQVNLQLVGQDAQNYELDKPVPTLTATIDKKIISAIQGITAKDKVHDGTTKADLNLDAAIFDGMIVGDELGVQADGHFTDAVVGSDKTVHIENIVLTGADAQNYQLADVPFTTTGKIKDKVIYGAMDYVPIGGSNLDITPLDISSMDIETALLAVQSQRANLLESQLRDQIAGVQARNDQIGKLNTVSNSLRALLAVFSTSQNSIQITAGSNIDQLFQQLKVDAQSAGVDIGSLLKGNVLNKADIEALQTGIKGQIDSASNSQQMDMQRLQSLSAKRNEAYDAMANFIKKMQDSRDSFISNMRNVVRAPKVVIVDVNGKPQSSTPSSATPAADTSPGTNLAHDNLLLNLELEMDHWRSTIEAQDQSIQRLAEATDRLMSQTGQDQNNNSTPPNAGQDALVSTRAIDRSLSQFQTAPNSDVSSQTNRDILIRFSPGQTIRDQLDRGSADTQDSSPSDQSLNRATRLLAEGSKLQELLQMYRSELYQGGGDTNISDPNPANTNNTPPASTSPVPSGQDQNNNSTPPNPSQDSSAPNSDALTETERAALHELVLLGLGGDGTYDNGVTREEFAAMLTKALGLDRQPDGNSLSDSETTPTPWTKFPILNTDNVGKKPNFTPQEILAIFAGLGIAQSPEQNPMGPTGKNVPSDMTLPNSGQDVPAPNQDGPSTESQNNPKSLSMLGGQGSRLSFAAISAQQNGTNNSSQAPSQQAISDMPNPTANDLLQMQQQMQNWTNITQIQSEITKELGDTLKGVVQRAQ